MDFSLLTMCLLVGVMLHVTEEFQWPGGFVEWYRELVPPKTEGVRTGYLVWINTLMTGMAAVPLYLGPTSHGASIWFAVAIIGAANACFHLWGVWKLRKYSPGVVTGVLIYLPLALYGGVELLTSGLLEPWRAGIWFAVAIGYHLFSVRRQAG
jgi:hypothetical protein